MLNSRKLISLIFISFAFNSVPVLASDAPVLPTELDLATAIRIADLNNPLLNQAREKIRESSGTLVITRSSILPKLDAFGIYQVDQQDRVGSFGGESDPDDELWSAGVEFRQPIYAGGKSKAAIRAGRYDRESIESDAQTKRMQVMTDIHRKYFNALLAREVIGVQQESLDLIQQQLAIAKNRFDAGAGPRFDVLQAEVRVANARPPLIRAQNEYRISIDDLRTTMGAVYAEDSGPTNVTLTGSWNEQPLTYSLEEAITQSLTNRPELVSADKQRAAATERVRRYKREHNPTLDFFANYSFENDRYSPGSETLEGWQAGLQAKMQIFEGGRIRGQVVQAQSQLDQIMYQEEAIRLAIELEVRSAWNNALEAKEIQDASELVISQAEEALRLAQNRYSVGALTQLDVLSSQLEFTRAKLEHITAAHNYNLALIDLQRAVGEMPGAHYLAE